MFQNNAYSRKLSLTVVAIVLALATLVGCQSAAPQETTTVPVETDAPTTVPTTEPEIPTEPGAATVYWVGDTMADFTVTTSDGKEMTLSKLLETKELVILNFWATWCGPCQMEFPYMEEAYLKYQDKVEIIALSIEPTDTNDVIEAFKTDIGLTALPMGQDTTGLSSRFYFEGIPTSVAIDRFGVICWQESGSITSTDKFERLFSGFLGADYTESKVGYSIPGPKPTVENADDATLTAALNAEGSAISVSNTTDPSAWPFLPTEGGALKSSNALMDETNAAVQATVSVKAGDALAFDYVMSSEAGMDFLMLEVDGELVEVFSGEEAGIFAYGFTADGEHTVTFLYRKDMEVAGGEDYALIDNLQLLSGDAAAAAVAAMPTYPLSLEGTDCQIIPVDGKEAIVSDPNGMYDLMMESTPTYVANGTEATFTIKLGKDLNPKTAVLYTYTTEYTYCVSNLAQTEDGFTVTLPLSSLETDGYSSTFVFLHPNILEDPNNFILIYVFANEENMNTFVQQELPYYGIENATWTYADGTDPSTDSSIQPDLELPEGFGQYVVYFVDQNGDPVANVVAQICDAESCQVVPSDEYGIVGCIMPAYAYEIHVLSVPEGYTFDTEAVYIMPAEGGELVIQGTKN